MKLKVRILALCFLAALVGSLSAQVLGDHTRAQCVPGPAAPFLYDLATPGVYYDCTAQNTYTARGGGGETLTFSAPLVRTLDNVACTVATGSVPGCISAANWTTFNAKQPPGSYLTALTGDVVAAGPGSSAAVIQALRVTNAMLAGSIDPAKLIGGTFGAGDYVFPSNVTVGTSVFDVATSALATASAPTVTPVGATGATTWAYKCQAYRYSGSMAYSTASSTTTVTNGNATLDGTNKNNVACAAVANANFIAILRVTAGGTPTTLGPIGSVAGAGGTLVDNGIAGPATFGGVPVGSTSIGLFTSSYINQADLGDVENALWFGTPRSSLPRVAYARACCTKNMFAHAGPTDNAFANAVFLSVPTTVAGNAIEAITLTNGAADTGEGGAALYAEAGNIGSTDSNQEQGIEVVLGVHGAGNILEGNGVNVLQPSVDSSGLFGSWYAFLAPDVPAVTVVTGQAVSYYTNMDSATDHWAFYGAGTAASHFGGNLEIPSVTINTHACSIVATVLTCP